MFKRLNKTSTIEKFSNYKDHLSKNTIDSILSEETIKKPEIYYYADKNSLISLAVIEYLPDQYDRWVPFISTFTYEKMSDSELKKIIKDLVMKTNVKLMFGRTIPFFYNNVNYHGSSKNYSDTYEKLMKYGGIKFI